MPIDVAKITFRQAGRFAMAPHAWGEEFAVRVRVGDQAPPPAFERIGRFAVVCIDGPIVQHKHWCLDSFDSILERARAGFESDAEAVCLKIGSPGGDVNGCFDTTRALRAMAGDFKKDLVAFTDSMAASAAYALACSASKLYVTSTARVGSIGVIEAMCDQSERDKQLGVRYVLIASGERKTDGNPHQPISKAAMENLQYQVDGMSELFFDLVNELRGIPQASTRALQAKLLFGEQAVAAGLADGVTTWADLCQTEQVATSKVAQPGAGATVMPQASYLRHMLKSVAEAEEGDFSDKEKEHAKHMLKMLDEEPGEHKAEGKAEGEEPKEEPKKEEKAEGKKAATEEKEAKAEKEEPEKAEGKKAMALATTSTEVDVARRLHALEVERAQEKDQAARTALLAKRPDFSPEIVSTLAKASLSQLKEAVETWPRIASKLGQAAAAAQVGGSRGTTQNDDGDFGVTGPDSALIDRKMGVSTEGVGIRRNGRDLELGFMTPESAKAFLEKKALPAGKVQ